MPADCSAGEGSRKNYGHTYVQAGPALQRPNEKPQRSAIDAVLALIHQVEKAKAKNLIASALFMDVKGAIRLTHVTYPLPHLPPTAIPTPGINIPGALLLHIRRRCRNIGNRENRSQCAPSRNHRTYYQYLVKTERHVFRRLQNRTCTLQGKKESTQQRRGLQRHVRIQHYSTLTGYTLARSMARLKTLLHTSHRGKICCSNAGILCNPTTGKY